MQIGPFTLSFASRKQVNEMISSNVKLASLGDFLLAYDSLLGNSYANKYITKEQQVRETNLKYRGESPKGNLLIRQVLETRAAYTVGRGLSIEWEGADEQKFVNEFTRRNRINLAKLKSLGRERCFEGQVLLALNPTADGIPKMSFISWSDTGYEVVSDPSDYSIIRNVRMLNHSNFNIDPARISFMKFHTRENSNSGVPLFAGVLDHVEFLDDALSLLRSVNTKAAKPTPHFKFDDATTAKNFQKELKDNQWQMGDALASSGDASMLQLGYGPYSAIDAQIITTVKIISGHVGVPPHYFGFSELLNNRAVADDIRSMFVTVGDTELDVWSEGFTALVGRAMAMCNQETGSKLNHQTGRVLIEQISIEQFAQVLALWLPVWLAGGITTETFLSKLPGVNEKKEFVAVTKELAERARQTPGELQPKERAAAAAMFKANLQEVSSILGR